MDNSIGSSLKLAINIINANDDVKDSLSDGNVKTFKTKDGLAFAYDPDLYDTYDDLADDALPTLKLGVINLDDSEYYDQPELTHTLAEYMGAENDNDIDLSILPDFSDFVDENRETIDKAIKQVDEKYYGSINMDISNADDGLNGSEESQTDEVKENTVYDPTSGTFSSDSTDNAIADNPDDEQLAASAGELPVEGPTTPPDYEADESNENGNTTAEPLDNNFASKLPKIDSKGIEPKTPKWLDLAREMFGNANQAELSMYDPYTRKQLQSQIIEVEQNIAQGQGEGVRRIYNRILAELPELEKAFEADFKENADKHSDTISTIDANEKDDVERITKEKTDKYNLDKQKYVESCRPALEDKYDAEHKANFTKSLSAALNEIHINSEALRHQEEKKFNDFKKVQKDKYIESQLKSSVDIDDIIADFNKLVEADNELLKKEASKFADRVAVVTKDVVNKLRKSQAEAKKYEADYRALKDTYDQKVDATVSAKTEQNLSVLHSELDAKKRDLKAALAENNTVKQALADEQKKNNDLNVVAEQYKAQVELYKNHPMQYQQPMTQPFIQTPYQQTTPVQAPQIQPQQAQQPQPKVATSSQDSNKKKHTGGTIAGVVVGLLAVVGLSVGGTALAMNHNDNNQVRTTATSSSSSSTQTQPSIASDNKDPKYKAGDTWSYYNKEDQKNYTVTMDNSTMGHYTDGNGQQHTVTLKSNN